ncbi:lithostathine-like [Sorex fumeus]|uniref:lithostathine-like n=1 Tax=Sorex fumeus TaxID=62283 RepID=UPI0024AD0304|nr:lithostathine-like [Sorex fumeus]
MTIRQRFGMLSSVIRNIRYGEDLKNEELLPRIRCPQHSFAYDNRCYAFYMSPKSWMDAAFKCRKRPYGDLVSVLTESEANFVATLINESNNETPLVWIGLHDPSEGSFPNTWEWIASNVMDYVAWEYGVPTGSGYRGTVSYRSGYKYWKGHDCTKHLPYVCKFRY